MLEGKYDATAGRRESSRIDHDDHGAAGGATAGWSGVDDDASFGEKLTGAAIGGAGTAPVELRSVKLLFDEKNCPAIPISIV